MNFIFEFIRVRVLYIELIDFDKFYRQEMMKFTTDYMDNYYFKPWTRAPPYMIGIWTGWFLHRAKQSKLQIPRVRIQLFYIILLAAVIISTAYRLNISDFLFSG